MFEVYRLAAIALFIGCLYALHLFFRSRGVLRALYVLVAVALCFGALVSAHVVTVPFLALVVK